MQSHREAGTLESNIRSVSTSVEKTNNWKKLQEYNSFISFRQCSDKRQEEDLSCLENLALLFSVSIWFYKRNLCLFSQRHHNTGEFKNDLSADKSRTCQNYLFIGSYPNMNSYVNRKARIIEANNTNISFWDSIPLHFWPIKFSDSITWKLATILEQRMETGPFALVPAGRSSEMPSDRALRAGGRGTRRGWEVG